MSNRHPAMEPGRDEVAAMMAAATSLVTDFLGSVDTAPTAPLDFPASELTELFAPPGDRPGDLDDLLATFRDAAAQAAETVSPGFYAYFPGGGLFASALAELLAATVNRYTGSGAMAPKLVAMEHGVIQWFCSVFGLPPTAGGVLSSGASSGNLSALVTARQHRLGGPDRTGTLYVTEHTHHSVAKAAMIAGFTPDQVRLVPVTADFRMDPTAAEQMIAADRTAGLRPFLLIGTAGTTNTGTIDPLADLAEVARRHGLWFHVDAAYGGAFQLTARGRVKLAGIEQADSITLDAHKSLFMPYSTGILLVRDPRLLRSAHSMDADYLQDLALGDELPNWADHGTELTRPFRGLRLWLPLHLYGVDAFRSELDEKLDLSEVVRRELRELPVIATSEPDLTVHTFRAPGGEKESQQLLERIHASRRVALTSTRINGDYALRLCVLSHRTHRSHVDEALGIIRAAALAA
ncbi:aromatic-L-amino-acid decarboxylase [Allocatelliglobosispora scoriae]|uniref:Aromatic-L-amino-acid decarboxylase n=1 Tax=Allocatelliglobosispora scoriae TaxID=643052 RepID=A0A841BPF0_9ACTN|nr:aminotransferase class V-fold PLP-dependent enzyme [Allocatelliglobosispora scoriae]MBB5869555.1 aromatic-L-amino-acid decarboxylase [Allocatelliglobosispora scoriae]